MRTFIKNTGISLPPVIFGTSALGNLYTALSDETKMQIVSECFNHVPKPVVFDSAGKYGAGLALEKLGSSLQRLGIKPDEVIISNKLGWLRTELKTPEPTFEPGVWRDLENDAVQKISYEGILECFEQGCALLGNNYIPQMLSVHDPDEYLAGAGSEREREKRFHDIKEGYKALAQLKKEGKTKAIGIGAKSWKVIRELAPHVDLDWVMIANSLTIMQQPADLLSFMDELNRNDIRIINSAVFHSGFLTGGNFFDYKLIDPDNESDRNRLAWRESFFAVCKRHHISPALACVNFAMSVPGVVAVSLNTSNPSRVKENVNLTMTPVSDAFYRDMQKAGLLG